MCTVAEKLGMDGTAAVCDGLKTLVGPPPEPELVTEAALACLLELNDLVISKAGTSSGTRVAEEAVFRKWNIVLQDVKQGVGLQLQSGSLSLTPNSKREAQAKVRSYRTN